MRTYLTFIFFTIFSLSLLSDVLAPDHQLKERNGLKGEYWVFLDDFIIRNIPDLKFSYYQNLVIRHSIIIQKVLDEIDFLSLRDYQKDLAIRLVLDIIHESLNDLSATWLKEKGKLYFPVLFKEFWLQYSSKRDEDLLTVFINTSKFFDDFLINHETFVTFKEKLKELPSLRSSIYSIRAILKKSTDIFDEVHKYFNLILSGYDLDLGKRKISFHFHEMPLKELKREIKNLEQLYLSASQLSQEIQTYQENTNPWIKQHAAYMDDDHVKPLTDNVRDFLSIAKGALENHPDKDSLDYEELGEILHDHILHSTQVYQDELEEPAFSAENMLNEEEDIISIETIPKLNFSQTLSMVESLSPIMSFDADNLITVDEEIFKKHGDRLTKAVNFGIAHELGHVIIGKTDNPRIRFSIPSIVFPKSIKRLKDSKVYENIAEEVSIDRFGIELFFQVTSVPLYGYDAKVSRREGIYLSFFELMNIFLSEKLDIKIRNRKAFDNRDVGNLARIKAELNRIEELVPSLKTSVEPLANRIDEMIDSLPRTKRKRLNTLVPIYQEFFDQTKVILLPDSQFPLRSVSYERSSTKNNGLRQSA